MAQRQSGEFDAVETHEINAACMQWRTDMERRMSKVEDDKFKEKIWDALNNLGKDFERLNGKIAGFLVASGVAGSVIGVLGGALVQYLLRK